MKFRKLFTRGNPLTDEEVQALRDKAKAYRDSGGDYLTPVEMKLKDEKPNKQ